MESTTYMKILKNLTSPIFVKSVENFFPFQHLSDEQYIDQMNNTLPLKKELIKFWMEL